MSDTAAAAESGPLSVDQAVASLTQQEAPADVAPVDDEPEASADGEQSEAPSEADDNLDPEETPAIEGEEDQEPESDPEEAPPAIAAPSSWTADEKARFATLPRETQEFLSTREAERDAAVSRAKREASDARKGAEELTTWKAQADTVLAQAQQTFADRWAGGNPDWLTYLQQHGADATLEAKLQFDDDQQQLQQLHAVQQQAETIAFQSHWAEVRSELPKAAPELADPKEGAARIEKVERFLLDGKVATADDLKWATAEQLGLAYDALRWREAQANITARPSAPKPAAAPAARTVRPSAPPPQQSQQARTAQTAKNRFAQTHSVEDAVALLLAKGT